jgi:hypothetical protein
MDPFTMMAVGATAGAILNPNDPVKGAVMGGAMGYGGGSALGIGATQAAAPIVNATYAPGAAQIAGFTAGEGAALGGGLAAPTSMISSVPVQGIGTPASKIGARPFLSSGNEAFKSMGMSIPDPVFASQQAAQSGGLLGGSTKDQLLAANMLLGSGNRQPQQPLPRAPAIQSRPYTGMQRPVNTEEEEMRRRMAYSMPQMPEIRLI